MHIRFYRIDIQNDMLMFSYVGMPNMVDTLTRKIYFYKLELKKDNSTVNPESVFAYLSTLPFSEDGVYLPVSDGNMRSIYVDHHEYPIRCRLGTKRRNGLPLLEQEGETEPLLLPNGSGLYEPMHFVIFDNNIVGFEFNVYAPRPSGLKTYLQAKCQALVNEVELIPLVRTDFYQQLARMGEVRHFVLRVHRDAAIQMQDLNHSLYTAFGSLIDLTDSETIEVTLKRRRSRGCISLPFMDTLGNWLNRESVRAGVEAAKVYARDNISGEMREFDLLQEYIRSSKRVVTQDALHRCINTTEMYRAIVESHDELRREIDQILHRNDNGNH